MSQQISINPMEARLLNLSLAHSAPRCLAKTRAGTPCQAAKLYGKKRCRLHGGASPGAPRGERHGRYRHGLRTIETQELLRAVRTLLRGCKD
jgi:hypothetical protein